VFSYPISSDQPPERSAIKRGAGHPMMD